MNPISSENTCTWPHTESTMQQQTAEKPRPNIATVLKLGVLPAGCLGVSVVERYVSS